MSSEHARARSHTRTHPHTKRSRTRDKLTNVSRCHQRVRVPTRPYTHHVCAHTCTCSALHTHPYSSTHAVVYMPNILVRTHTHACNRVHACTRAHTHARPPTHAPGHPHTCACPHMRIPDHPPPWSGPQLALARPARTCTRERTRTRTRTPTRPPAPARTHSPAHTHAGPYFFDRRNCKITEPHFWTLHCQNLKRHRFSLPVLDNF